MFEGRRVAGDIEAYREIVVGGETRSYLVHRNAIAKVTKNDIVLTNGHEIPIGDQYRSKIIQKHIDSYNISSART